MQEHTSPCKQSIDNSLDIATLKMMAANNEKRLGEILNIIEKQEKLANRLPAWAVAGFSASSAIIGILLTSILR